MACLWMGDLELYMDENFIKRAFATMGELVTSVKVISNRMTGGPAGYCFVELADIASVDRCLHRLNGKFLPGSNPPKKFKLNHANYGRKPEMGPDYSVFVGDLSADVDDFQLYDFFMKKYPSCRGGKVVTDTLGYSRGYGFVKFGDEAEQKKALEECHGAKGLGEKPIRLSYAIPKSTKTKSDVQATPSTYDAAQYYQQYMNYCAQWGYDPYSGYNYAYSGYGTIPSASATFTADSTGNQTTSEETSASTVIYEEEPVEDPEIHTDIDEMNRKFMGRSEELYDSLMNCHWQPLDTATSEIPAAV